MDSGVMVLRRDAIEVQLGKDRGEWSAGVAVDGWREAIPFPLLEGFGRESGGPDVLAPRPDRDPARRYDVPSSVRWLIRILLGQRFEDVSDGDSLSFRREPVTIDLVPTDGRWSAHLSVDGRPPIELPRFHGFAGR